MDAKIWTVGATLFAFLYLTMGVYLAFSTVVVALILAAWVMGKEVGGDEGVKYVNLELRPALAFVGIFAVTLVALGPLRDGYLPPLIGSTLFSVQYAYPLTTMVGHPIWFFFPLLPLVLGGAMSAYQEAHPMAGVVYQTSPTPSTRVHVHLHQGRRARDEEEEDEESDEAQELKEAPPPRRHRHTAHPVRLPLRSQRALARSVHHPHRYRDGNAEL